jgi:hypothetical protein
MTRLLTMTSVALFAITSAASEATAAVPPKVIKLPDSETAVAMTPPALPARIAGDCPSSDKCEFGTNWRACEAIPVYRQARDGAPLLRMLKADEKFVAKGGEIELTAPGEIVMLGTSSPAQTGGLALQKGLKLAVYGPMPGSRALYFDPVSGKGWSPDAVSDDFWRDDKIAKLTRAPAMTWWLKARLGDRSIGWLQLKAVPDLKNFPMYYSAEALQSWNVDMVRDDESPDCEGMLKIKTMMAQ